MFKQHPNFEHAGEISEICKPLQKLNISYFSHTYIDNEKNFSGICSHPEFYRHYLKNHYYNADIHLVDDKTLGNFVVWDTIEPVGLAAQMNEEGIAHGIDHTFTIVKKQNDGHHYFHFSTHLPSKSFNQVYLSNFDLLNLFIEYFKNTVSQSKPLLEAYQIKLMLDHKTQVPILKDPTNVTCQARSEFLSSIQVPQVSPREEQCLQYTIRGKSAKEIANILGISFRTVETHLENLKNKFNLKSKAQLIEMWVQRFYGNI